MDFQEGKTKGITLIALVITIIILLILAGITIGTLFGENGIITRATKASEEYKIAEAREKLSLVLIDAGIEKVTNIKYNQDAFLDQFIKDNLEGSKIKGDIAIVDGYAFNLDRSVPKIGEYLGKEEDLKFPDLKVETQISDNNDSATIKITAQEDKNGISKIEVILDGDVVHTYDNYNNTKDEIKEEYTTDKNGTYTIKVYSKLENTCITEVKGVISPIVYEPDGSEQYAKEFQVTVSVSESNEKVKSIKYQWTNSTREPEKESFTETIANGGTVTKNGLTGTYYLWTLLETESGATRTGKSEAFYFDNKGPNVTVTSTAVSTTSFTLKAEATDEHVKTIAKYEFYANGKLVNTQTTSAGTASYTVTGMTIGTTNCYVKVTDGLGNEGQSSNYSAVTKLYTWEKWSCVFVSKTYHLTKTGTRQVYPNNYVGSNIINLVYDPHYFGNWNETIGTFDDLSRPAAIERNKNLWGSWGHVNTIPNIHWVCTSGGGWELWTVNMGTGWHVGSYPCFWLVEEYKTETRQNYKKGDTQYKDVTSTSSTTYPNNDQSGSYWYVYKGLY